MRSYAQGTAVPVEQSRAEVDRLLTKHGATATAIVNNEETNLASVGFQIKGARYRLDLPLPTPEDLRALQGRKGLDLAQLRRERWRALLLHLKSKLAIVAMGLSSVEHEFLADLVLPNGATVHQVLSEEIRKGLGTGPAPKQLGGRP